MLNNQKIKMADLRGRGSMTEKVWLKNYPAEIPHEIDIPKYPYINF